MKNKNRDCKLRTKMNNKERKLLSKIKQKKE